MADGMSITEPKIEVVHSSVYDDSPDAAQATSRDPYIFNMDTNYANENKWFASYQLEDVLGKDYRNLNLHLTKFSIPQLMQG